MKYFHIHRVMLFGIFLLVLLSCCKKDEPCPVCPSPPTDTTSHDFAWTTYTLGDGSGSSILYDIAIINDTLAYAVGEIWRNDTSFNVAKWDGKTWQLMQILYSYNGQSYYNPIHSIFAFNSNDIWFGIASVIHYDGTQFLSMQTPLTGLAYKMWGSNSSDLYIVGGGGSIVHYNGSSWTKIESGTTLNMYDIYGAYNSLSKQWEILAVAGNVGSSYDRKILKITGTSASSLSDTPIAWPLNGVWFVPCEHYYVVGSGIYEKNSLSENNWTVHLLDITTYYTGAIRGNAVNDVIVGGAYGELLHYNGSTWKSYISEVGLGSNGVYGSVAIKNNLVIAVGENNPLAAIAIGKR